MIKKRKIAAILLTVIFVVAVMFSFIFIAESHEHNCTGASCPVCAAVQVAEEISGSAKNNVAVFALFAFLVAFLFTVKVKKQLLSAAITPISLSDILTI